ncbi:hypothetical protein PLESTB_000639900 [Pleodorina starrii]|uniref:Glutathione S-transferase n=1 Tax=Pleodorina starrii TaxID=330485 RepID=A0A9W6F1U3_9CHLO|nr:hypothetical protein PLESTM_001301200 [Pleodorina starrii]GLC52531.1 hypothetical protein PLESTB_000639900 [Pleodorina starrii]GLC71531.1 hypothetical protein PLESTF_001132000 [Pleodorina starrii]
MSAIRNLKPFQSGPSCPRAVTRRPCVRTYAATKLYSNPASRGRIIEWYLHELGVAGDVEVVNLDMREKREHKSDWFKQVNPFGKLPALEDGDLKLFESGAILLYLADKYGKLSSPQERARATQWSLFANSTMTNAVFVEQWRERSMPDIFRTLDELLSRQSYIEGDSFSVSDVAVGAYLLYIPAFLPQLDLTPYPNVLAYMKRMAERPACAATVAARATEKKAETATADAAAPAKA